MEMEAEAEADDTEEETEVQPYQTPSPHPPARLIRRSNAALYCMPAIIAFCVEAQALCLQYISCCLCPVTCCIAGKAGSHATSLTQTALLTVCLCAVNTTLIWAAASSHEPSATLPWYAAAEREHQCCGVTEAQVQQAAGRGPDAAEPAG